MDRKFLKIKNIPAILWGEKSDKLIIAIHGNMSNKEDVPIKILAKISMKKGYQVLSFDLTGHGERKDEGEFSKVQDYIRELSEIIDFAKENWKNINLFGNSIGAYFGLLAYKDEKLSKAWFLSPVTDMKRIIENMMKWCNITEERLKEEKTISTQIGQNLYWNYWEYVKENPIEKWEVPTYILYGEKDSLCEKDFVIKFAEKFHSDLKISEESEHWFHTEKDLEELKKWLCETI